VRYFCYLFCLFSKTDIHFSSYDSKFIHIATVTLSYLQPKIKVLNVLRRKNMGGCDPVTFQNVNQSVFDCIKNKLSAAGTPVPPGSSGRMTGLGVTADFSWDGVSNLMIHVIEKPWIVSNETVIEKISDFVYSCGGIKQ
jgi:hypothetical protein